PAGPECRPLTAPPRLRRRMRLNCCLLALLGLPAVAPAQPARAKSFSAEALAYYEKDVLPILKGHCYKCHGEGKVKEHLSLSTRDAILKGGDLGPAVDLDRPDDSNLLRAINYKGGLEMPPTGKLAAEQIDALTRWVKAGLPMKDGAAVRHETKGGVVTPEARNYWAYRPVKRPPVPPVKSFARVANPIDAFLLTRLEEKGLAPAPPADRVALVRRLYYDLTGLPPTPEQVDAFVHDRSPAAY